MKNAVRQQAEEYIQKKIDEYKAVVAKTGEKRENNYLSYVTFSIESEMEAKAHLEILENILFKIKFHETEEALKGDLGEYKEGLKRLVLGQRIGFSTSQTSNLFNIITKNVESEYCRDNYGTMDNVIRILNKQDGIGC